MNICATRASEELFVSPGGTSDAEADAGMFPLASWSRDPLLCRLSVALVQALNYENLLEGYSLDSAMNTSDALLTVDPATFVNLVYVGPTDAQTKPAAARRTDLWVPSEKTINTKILDIMKQTVLATQDRMRSLNPFLDKYRHDPAFRMNFIYNRLRQYIIDIRRIYTLAVTRDLKYGTREHITWYQHCARKHVDIIYIVEHVIDLHEQFMKKKEEQKKERPHYGWDGA